MKKSIFVLSFFATSLQAMSAEQERLPRRMSDALFKTAQDQVHTAEQAEEDAVLQRAKTLVKYIKQQEKAALDSECIVNTWLTWFKAKCQLPHEEVYQEYLAHKRSKFPVEPPLIEMMNIISKIAGILREEQRPYNYDRYNAQSNYLYGQFQNLCIWIQDAPACKNTVNREILLRAFLENPDAEFADIYSRYLVLQKPEAHAATE